MVPMPHRFVRRASTKRWRPGCAHASFEAGWYDPALVLISGGGGGGDDCDDNGGGGGDESRVARRYNSG